MSSSSTRRVPAVSRTIQAVGLCLLIASSHVAFVPAVSAAEAFDAKTKADIQNVITNQLAALSRGDAKAAEEFAAPAIKEKFPEPGKFFDMVKENYGALIHPKSTQFNETSPSPHGPLQKMTVVAADGTVWSAIYSFEQVDGQWRITGCGLERDETQQEI